MSRIAKKGIAVPSGVTVTLEPTLVKVQGKNGTIELVKRPQIEITNENGMLAFEAKSGDRLMTSLVGTYAARITAMIAGVQEPFKKTLILEGVGYRAEMQGTNLKMALGFSHPVIVPVPEGITVTVEKSNVNIEGIDKVVVGQFAAYIRSLKKPEPYKGKGFRYSDEQILRKQGKKSV